MMTIGDLSLQSNVPASTIRYWERIKILPKPERVGGKRRYSNDALNHLAVLRLAQSCGFTLDEMRQLFYGFRSGTAASQRWQVLASKKKQELDERLRQLNAMRKLVDRVMDCKCVELAECARIAVSALKENTT